MIRLNDGAMGAWRSCANRVQLPQPNPLATESTRLADALNDIDCMGECPKQDVEIRAAWQSSGVSLATQANAKRLAGEGEFRANSSYRPLSRSNDHGLCCL